MDYKVLQRICLCRGFSAMGLHCMTEQNWKLAEWHWTETKWESRAAGRREGGGVV